MNWLVGRVIDSFVSCPRSELLFHKIVAAQHCSSRSDSHEHAHGPIALVVGRACGAIAQHHPAFAIGVDWRQLENLWGT